MKPGDLVSWNIDPQIPRGIILSEVPNSYISGTRFFYVEFMDGRVLYCCEANLKVLIPSNNT